MELIHILGNTYCIDTGASLIPLYHINDEKVILLDSGWITEREGLEEILEAKGWQVAGILCSHVHVDHTGNIAYFKEKHKSLIAMTEQEAIICSSPLNLKMYFSNNSLKQVLKQFGHMLCSTDIKISPEQTRVELCGVEFQILPTPGHTVGHICIVTPDNVAYMGDCLASFELLKRMKLPYTFVVCEDLQSKAKLYALRCNKYIVAHRGVYNEEEIEELIDENIHLIRKRSEGIYGVIKGPMTLEEIIKAVLKHLRIRIPAYERYEVMERRIRSYLEYLLDTGVVEVQMVDGLPKYVRTDPHAKH